jgi:glycosyltransferase involved in cell wall biosynthesis
MSDEGVRTSRPSSPRVTVGIPVYNGEAFIAATLDAIVAQTFRDYEVLIADNASTDNTAIICRRYVERDQRFHYIRNETNLGIARNINKIVGLAAGQYFKLTTADDYCAPELIAKCVEALDADARVVLAYAKTTLIDAAGLEIGPYEDNLDLRSPSPVERFRLAVARMALIHALQGVVRLDVLRRTALMQSYLGSDNVLLAELALHGQFREIPERLFSRRIHAKAFSSLPSVDLKQEFLDPRTKGKISLPIWRSYRGYLTAVARAPLSARDKLRLTFTILRYASWERERLAREIIDAGWSLRRHVAAAAGRHDLRRPDETPR